MTNSPVLLKLTHPNDQTLIEKAKWFSRQPGIQLLRPSKNFFRLIQGLSELPTLSELPDFPDLPVLQITRQGIFLETQEMRFNFHPSMALIRLIQIQRGEADRFLHATGLQPGDRFLDATLGLGTDALVAATQIGGQEHVLGIEYSPLLAALIREGLMNLAKGPLPNVENPDKVNAWLALSQAARRIEVKWGDHLYFLKDCPDSSVDVIYFDPMFRQTKKQSASIRPLHHFSNTLPLQMETVKEACRVARKRVVLKERKGSPEFSRLGFRILEGGKYSNVDYGIIEV